MCKRTDGSVNLVEVELGKFTRLPLRFVTISSMSAAAKGKDRAIVQARQKIRILLVCLDEIWSRLISLIDNQAEQERSSLRIEFD